MSTSAPDAPTAPVPSDFTLPKTMSGWRARLLGLRHWHAVGLITGLSVVASLLVTWLVVVLAGRPEALSMSLLTAVLVPLLVAPLVSHSAMGLLYEVEAARAQLHQAAIRDGLTHAYNRRFFMARLEEEAPRARRMGVPLSVLMIDIDHFKAINDAHGHAAGDVVLADIARLLTQSMRPYDLVARYGGEEFVALMPGADLSQARATAERVRMAVQSMRGAWAQDESASEGMVTASLGCSCLGDDRDNPGAMLERADRAMYAAKRGGRNRCVVLPPDLRSDPSEASTDERRVRDE
jgi:diguanylate cyclase (GGDEF)-like protein